VCAYVAHLIMCVCVCEHQTLQKAMANITSSIARQTADGTLTANTNLWGDLVSLEEQLSAVKRETDAHVQLSASNNNSTFGGRRTGAAVAQTPSSSSNTSQRNGVWAVNTDPVSVPRRANAQVYPHVSLLQQESPDDNNSVSSSGSFSGRILRQKSSNDLLNRSKSAERMRPVAVGSDQVWKTATCANNSLLSSIPNSPVLKGASPNRLLRTWSGAGTEVASLNGSNVHMDTRFDVDEQVIGTVELLYQDQYRRSGVQGPAQRSRSSTPVGTRRAAMKPDNVAVAPEASSSNNMDSILNTSQASFGINGGGPMTASDLGSNAEDSAMNRSSVWNKTVVKDLFRTKTNIVEGKANNAGSGRPLLKTRSQASNTGSQPMRASSAGRFRRTSSMSAMPGTSYATPGVINNSVQSTAGAANGRNSVNMSIFKGSSASRSRNVNVFDPDTLRWKPTHMENKYNERFQSTSDLLLQAKLNAAFYGED
jgi:hypothetical protein